MLDLAATVPNLSGIELVGNWHINDDNIERMKAEVRKRGLSICMLTPDLWTQAKWGRGSLAAPDAPTRRAAVREVQKVMDWAAAAGSRYVDVWPGQDGYDYYFQSDYQAAWKWLIEGVRACADHRDDVTVLIEYKPREPRTHIYVSSVGKTLQLVDEVDRKNVSVLLDLGHASQGGENPAESIALLQRPGVRKLAYMHFNDNWHAWDDDMMVGSVHHAELLEVMYWLLRTKYDGWLTLDIFPYREDGVKASTESIAWIEAAIKTVERVGLKAIDELVRKADATEVSRFLRGCMLR
jgi:xylose isomerase